MYKYVSVNILLFVIISSQNKMLLLFRGANIKLSKLPMYNVCEMYMYVHMTRGYIQKSTLSCMAWCRAGLDRYRYTKS